MIHAQEISFVYTKESLVYTQEISCARTTLLCSGPGNPGAIPQKGRGPGLGPAQAPFLGPGPWVPWPRACTRVLCMHKRSLVYTQEILLCIHKRLLVHESSSIIINHHQSSSITFLKNVLWPLGPWSKAPWGPWGPYLIHFNTCCNHLKNMFFIVLPIVLPFGLPIELPIPPGFELNL